VEKHNVDIHSVQFTHILETSDLERLDYFLSRTAFVISHKSENIETLLRVLWYLPVNSTIIIVTNCPEMERDEIARELKRHLVHHKRTYLVHQKDEAIAQVFKECGVYHILDANGKVIDGKGEGMYIGALCAYQLGYPQWVIFYDADNFVPSALLEYTLAMSRLFMSAPFPTLCRECDTFIVQRQTEGEAAPELHNVRICWSSKPALDSEDWDARIVGRCTRIVSPLFNSLLEEWFGIHNHAICSSNAGEQGMTIKTAITLRFSSGFSVETFQLLDLLVNATGRRDIAERIILQQYLSKSPHFHDKKGDEHIKKMIEQSLGSFFHFEESLPDSVKRQLWMVYNELCLDLVIPSLYPPLQDLPLMRIESFMDRYSLFAGANCLDLLVAELEG
jgi:Mannosyl-3-phosphoglycerate synthase (osmo_MPGsynth)